MNAILYIEGVNSGASFLEKYSEQEINIESLYKDIDVNSPPLANLTTKDGKHTSLQLIDTRFIDEFIFLQCFAIDTKTKSGGKAFLRLKPVF